MNDEKQRVKRKEKRAGKAKQAVQVKIKKQKLRRQDLAVISTRQATMDTLSKVRTWFKLAFPKTHVKKWEEFTSFLNKKDTL